MTERTSRWELWPAVAATVLSGLGFTALKFVIIADIALAFDPARAAVPTQWLRDIVLLCAQHGQIKEALSQAMAAVLTFGIMLGFLVNAPLAGALRLAPLFAWSALAIGAFAAGFAADAAGAFSLNPWLAAVAVGAAYGATCAVRGKAIPVLARATCRTSTALGGFLNAALIIGLLGGTILGMALAEHLGSGPMRYALVALIFGLAGICGSLIRAPESRPVPFLPGLTQLTAGTARMFAHHWHFLVGGGLAWGIASGASLAVLLDGIERLHLSPTIAATIGIFPAIGAVIGNLLSTRLRTRWLVIASFLAMAACIGAYTHLVSGWGTAAVMMIFVGIFFAAPSNVLDARFLAAAAHEGLAGRGGTVMSLAHNIFILGVGGLLAAALLGRMMTAEQQFPVLALLTLGCAAISVFAPVERHDR